MKVFRKKTDHAAVVRLLGIGIESQTVRLEFPGHGIASYDQAAFLRDYEKIPDQSAASVFASAAAAAAEKSAEAREEIEKAYGTSQGGDIAQLPRPADDPFPALFEKLDKLNSTLERIATFLERQAEDRGIERC